METGQIQIQFSEACWPSPPLKCSFMRFGVRKNKTDQQWKTHGRFTQNCKMDTNYP